MGPRRARPEVAYAAFKILGYFKSWAYDLLMVKYDPLKGQGQLDHKRTPSPFDPTMVW